MLGGMALTGNPPGSQELIHTMILVRWVASISFQKVEHATKAVGQQTLYTDNKRLASPHVLRWDEVERMYVYLTKDQVHITAWIPQSIYLLSVFIYKYFLEALPNQYGTSS